MVVLPIPKVDDDDDGGGSLFAVVTARQQAAAAVVIVMPFISMYLYIICSVLFLFDLIIGRRLSLLLRT